MYRQLVHTPFDRKSAPKTMENQNPQPQGRIAPPRVHRDTAALRQEHAQIARDWKKGRANAEIAGDWVRGMNLREFRLLLSPFATSSIANNREGGSV
jgi:hypothetical protein